MRWGLRTLVAAAGLVCCASVAGAAECELSAAGAQSILARLGYYSGRTDGRLGPASQAALKRFQQSQGLPQTGALDEATLDELCDERVSLLFYHRPSGCPHCNYEKPQISAFERKHPEVAVTWRSAGSQSGAEQDLLAGTSGHPIMVFHVADHRRVVVGETSADELDQELATFLREVKTAQQRGIKVEQRTTLGATCY